MTNHTSITDLEDSYVVCRTLGHSWDENLTAELDGQLWKASTAGMALRCTRCFTERFDYIGNDLQVFQRYYRYPERYKTIPGTTTRPLLRGELLRRSLILRRANGKRRGRK